MRILTVLGFLFSAVTCFSQNVTNKGKEFWVGYGHHQFMETGTNTQNMEIYLSAEEQPATVKITIDSSGAIPALWWSRTYYIPAYTVISINDPLTPAVTFTPASAGSYGPMPKGTAGFNAANPTDINFDSRLWTVAPPAGTGGAGVFRKKGIHIQSNVPIVAYAHIWGSTSSGATMLLPVEAWGYSYVSLNSRQSYASNCYSWMYVIASKDNTVIEITPSVKTRAQDKTGLAPGVPTTVTLMKGQIYQVIGANDGSDANGNGGAASTGQQLTGTKVRSLPSGTGDCNPIAVFAGSSRTSNPASCGSGGGDNDNQQLFPTNTWGKRYLTAPFSGSPGANQFATCTYKIAVSDPTTVVKKNGVTLTGLQNNNFYAYESTTADYIEADKPIMMIQLMTGGGCIPGSWGDPSIVVLSPLEQGIKRTGFYRNNKESIQLNYLTLIVPTAGVTSLRIDGSSAFSYTYPHPNLAGYTVVIKQWPAARAQCLVACDSAFTAITYGIGSVESYAYNAGTYLNNLGAISDLHNVLDPTTPSHAFTCKGTPVEISALIAYKPVQIVWHLDSLASVLSPSTPVTMVNPVPVDTVYVNSIKYYKYTLPGNFMFSDTGTFYLPLSCTAPAVDNCNNTETLWITIIVKPSPKPDFSITHTGCTLDTVYFAGQNLAGTFTLSAWNWTLPGGINLTGENVQQILSPGTYNITLQAISTDGCVGDTVKSITVFDKPTATFGIVPPAVCLGQTVTLSDTSSYGGTSPGIGTWYWDLGDGTILNNPNGNNVIASYATPNTYTIKHVVKVSPNCVSDTAIKTVIISPEALIDFTYPTSCLPPTGVAQFNASATDLGGAPIVSYSWDFGDPGSGANNTSALQNPTHTYSTYGTYAVTLSIVTNTGCGGDTTINLTFGLQPALNYPALPAVCVNATPVSVATATVTNGVTGTGTYSGPGTDAAGMFDPAIAGVGTHTITYSFITPSCTETITQTITVNGLPTVSAGTYGPVCLNVTPVVLAGTPAGGTFSGPGVTGNNFDPATAGTGTHTITYAYTDANSCAASATTTITVNALPVVDAGTYGAVCIDAAPVNLAGTPAGGTFSGTGVTGATFDPATAAAGTHTITYSYNDAAGCAGSATTTITVNALPVVSAGTYGAVCVDAAAIALSGTPAGGVFSGPGVTGTSFDPAIAGAGTHTITYSYTDANGCSASAIANITVNALPVVNAGTYGAVCLTATPVALVGTPAGGTFSGPGVTGTIFDPAAAGTGTHTLTYTYTDANGCTNSAISTITVNTIIPVDAGTYGPLCIDAGPVTLAGSPAGGVFSGTGVTVTSFDPVVAGIGTHTITYSYTDANGCSNSAAVDITVNPLPVVNAGTYTAVCIDAAPVNLTGTPVGGTYSGTGVTGTTFDAATAGAGTHTITYSYTDANGCSASATATITVNPLPVVTAGTYGAICIDGGIVNLVGTPAGGVFSGPAVAGTTFDPATAGAGTHTITYSYTDANSCAASATATITVNALPVVDAGTYGAVCIDAGIVTLVGTPAGGTFSGTGVAGTNFDPTVAGAGTHNITYTYTDVNGCTNSANTSITVNDIPVLNAGTYPPVCINASQVTLAGIPAGGTFSGPGVSGTTFDPSVAGSGTHTITYGNVGGCSNTSVTTTIVVNPLPVVDGGTYNPVCINAGPVTLTGSPGGGTFSGTGVTGNSFDPAVAGAGATTLTYSYTDGNGCSNSATSSITVNALPVADAGTYSPVCIDAAVVTLSGTPAGGTFSGTAVTGNSFNPATAGPGTFTITYSYTDAAGCSASATTSITVNALPVVNAGTYTPVCANSAAVTLAGTPAGGTFSGTGVIGNSFDPLAAGAGTFTLTYNYTDPNGCSNTATTTITVNPLPVVNAGTYGPVCIDGAAITLAGTPAGGTFSGPGVTANNFIPATAGAGSHTVTYSYTDANGCTNTATTAITVNALPVVDAGTYAPVCIDAGVLTLAGTPVGGTFSGTGVTGYTFDPAIAGQGTFTITYAYADAAGCAGTATTAITVNALPVVNAGTYNPVCVEISPINLVGNPAGGTFSGAGVTGNAFDPGTVGPGIHTITYSYTASTGCTQTNSTTIEVDPRPVSSFTANNSICLDGTSTLTSSATISSGSITSWNWNLGNGNTPTYGNGNPFTVSYTTANTYTVQLTTISDKGCVSLPTTQTIDVHPLPVADFNVPTGICMPGGTAAFTNQSSVPDNSALSYVWNFGDGSGTSTATNPSHVYGGVGAYNVTLTATSAYGCVNTSAPKVVDDFYDKPTALFFVAPAEICQGENVVFNNQSIDPNSPIQSWNWTFGDGSNGTGQLPVKKFNSPGSYTISLTVTNQVGCKSDPYQQTVTVHLQPVVDAGRSFVVPLGTPIQFEATANSPLLTFTWTPPIGLNDPASLKPTLIATADETYTLTATGDFGCSASDFMTVKILKPVTVPNTFSPNGDGIHDKWLIPNLTDYPGNKVQVFNRYGQQVFYSEGYGTPWDGTFKGKDMPVGTYYYVIVLENGFKPMTGSITIIR